MNWKNIKEEKPEHDALVIYRDGHGGISKAAWHVGYGFSQHQILYKNGNDSVDLVEWIYVWELAEDE